MRATALLVLAATDPLVGWPYGAGGDTERGELAGTAEHMVGGGHWDRGSACGALDAYSQPMD